MLSVELEFVPGRTARVNPVAIPDCSGVYAIVMPGGDHQVNKDLLRRAGEVDFFATWPVLYVGATDDSLRSRIKAHYCRDSRSSTFRRSLGAFAADTLGLDIQRFPGSRVFCFHDEAPLTAWLEAETIFGFCPSEEPFSLEKVVLSAAPGLFNLGQREPTPVTRVVRDLRQQASGRGQHAPF